MRCARRRSLPAFRDAIVGASGRDQPGAAQAQQERTLSGVDVPVTWHRSAAGGAGRARHHSRQRILRRAAGASGGQAERRLARARDRDRRRRQSRFRRRAAIRCRISSSCCRRRCATRRSARSSNGAPTPCACELGRRVARRRRRRAGRSTTATPRATSAKPCRRSAQHAFADPLIGAGHASTSPRMSIFRRSAQAAESMGARVHGPIEQARFLRRLGIETRAAALQGQGRAASRPPRSTARSRG